MTPTEAAAAMRAILNRNESVDEEATHIQADSLMCEVLTALGCQREAAMSSASHGDASATGRLAQFGCNQRGDSIDWLCVSATSVSNHGPSD